MTGSAIHRTRIALWEALEAAEGLTGVQKAFGPPTEYEEAEVVALMGVRNPEEEPAQLGANSQNERFILDIRIKVHSLDADSAQAVDERGFEVADVVRGVSGLTRTTMNFSGSVPGLQWCKPISQTTDGVMPAVGGGWVIFIDIAFECFARIQGP